MTGRPPGPERKRYAFTDVGNAQRLVAEHGHHMRWVPRWKTWLVWDGRYWQRDETGEVERRAKQTTRDMWYEALTLEGDAKGQLVAHALKSEAAGKIRAMIDLARSEPGVAISYNELDQQPMLLNVRNGTIDLATGKLGPHNPTHLLTKMVQIDYDPDATCPSWISTLSVIFAGDQSVIDYVQRAVGYSITGRTDEQCLHLCHGSGSNGKSTILDVLGNLTGDYGQQADFSTFLERRHDSGPRNDVARLAGARLVRSSEVGDDKRLNEGLIKSLTGGDTITARFLYSEDFEFKPQFKLWLAANHKPVIRGTDFAIWRRVRLIPFEVTITEAQKDYTLPERLREELPGILAWAVDGCQQWLERGLHAPERVLAATAAYRADSDTIGTFIAECCEVSETLREPALKLYTAYKRWAEDNGEKVMSNTAFGKQLSERGYEKVRTMNGNVRSGLQLLDQEGHSLWRSNRPAA